MIRVNNSIQKNSYKWLIKKTQYKNGQKKYEQEFMEHMKLYSY